MRPTAFSHAQTTLRNLPYACVDGDGSKASVSGGVLRAGELVWTRDPVMFRREMSQVVVFNERAGTILVDAHGLIAAPEKDKNPAVGNEHCTRNAAERLTYEPSRAEIAQLAYELWEKRGRPAGLGGVDDWTHAEGELRALGPMRLRGSEATCLALASGPRDVVRIENAKETGNCHEQ